MDIKDVLLQNENSLPTVEQTMSTSTETNALTMTPTSNKTLWKFGVSSIVGLLGMYYLAIGKKQSDFGKMLIGAGLTLASFFMF